MRFFKLYKAIQTHRVVEEITSLAYNGYKGYFLYLFITTIF
jgi:hypothetical protein